MRKVNETMVTTGPGGIHRSNAGRIHQELNRVAQTCFHRPLEHEYPHLWLDAMHMKVRLDRCVVNPVLVIAAPRGDNGEREQLGMAIYSSHDEAFCQDVLLSFAKRGLRGVDLLTSDARAGLTAAAAKVLEGATWQRCRVHFMRNLLAHIPKEHKSMVARASGTIFAQPDRGRAGDQAKEVVRAIEPRWLKAAEHLRRAEDDILAYTAFRKAQCSRTSSMIALERLNAEIRPRTNAVGLFPSDVSVMCRLAAILHEMGRERRTRLAPVQRRKHEAMA